MTTQTNLWCDPATLHTYRQTTLTDGVRMFWLFTPETSPEGDLSEVTIFEAFNCETAAKYANSAEDPEGKWFEFSDEHETKHTHLRFVDSQETFDALLEISKMADVA